jgi:hypothetical protein
MLIRGVEVYKPNRVSLHKFYNQRKPAPASTTEITNATTPTDDTNTPTDNTTSSTGDNTALTSPEKKKTKTDNTTDPTPTAETLQEATETAPSSPTQLPINRQLSFLAAPNPPAQLPNTQLQLSTRTQTSLQSASHAHLPTPNEWASLLYTLSVNSEEQRAQSRRAEAREILRDEDRKRDKADQHTFNQQFIAHMTRQDKRNEQHDLQSQHQNQQTQNQPMDSTTTNQQDTTRSQPKRSYLKDDSPPQPPHPPTQNDD